MQSSGRSARKRQMMTIRVQVITQQVSTTMKIRFKWLKPTKNRRAAQLAGIGTCLTDKIRQITAQSRLNQFRASVIGQLLFQGSMTLQLCLMVLRLRLFPLQYFREFVYLTVLTTTKSQSPWTQTGTETKFSVRVRHQAPQDHFFSSVMISASSWRRCLMRSSSWFRRFCPTFTSTSKRTLTQCLQEFMVFTEFLWRITTLLI